MRTSISSLITESMKEQEKLIQMIVLVVHKASRIITQNPICQI